MTKSRIQYLDYLRVFSMLVVVFYHCFQLPLTLYGKTAGDSVWGAVFFLLKDLSRFAVPVFCMISGALFLNPDKEVTYRNLFRKYILKYALIILIFVWGSEFTQEIFTNHSIKLAYAWTGLCRTVSGEADLHLWYLYELIGLMLIVPLLKRGIDHFSGKDVRYAVFLLILFLSVLPLVRGFSGLKFGISLPVSSFYVLYLLLGWWIHNGDINISRRYCLIALAGFAVFCIIDTYCNVYRQLNLWHDNSSPVCIAFVCALFSLFKQMPEKKESGKPDRAVRTLARYSFAIYVYHFYLQYVGFSVIGINPFTTPVPVFTTLLIGVLSLILSFAGGFITKKIPFLRFLLF